MKIYIALLFAMAVGVVAHASIQTFVDQDKPTRLYVQSYTESVSAVYEGYDNTTDTDWPGYEDGTYNATLNESINYADGTNGSANCDQFEEFTDNDYAPDHDPYTHTITHESGTDNLSMSSGPTTDYSSVLVTQVETFSGSLFDSWDTGSEGEAAVGSTNTSTAIGLPVFSEHCDNNMPPVNYSASGVYALEVPYIYTWNYVEIYKRKAQIKYTLHAGGKSIPSSRNLFLLNGSASGWTSVVGNWGDNLGVFAIPTPDDGWINIPTYFLQFGGPGAYYVSIPLQTVSIGGLGNLDTNGLLYAGVAAGTDVDVTPHASGNQYLCDVGMTEYPVNITANGTNLSSATPEFCVGQNLLFQLNGLPGSVTNMVGQWHLPGNYVNQQTQYSSSCTSYVYNASLLINTNSTACWYIDQPGGTASIGLNLLFPNGRTATVAATGQFSIYKPQMILFTNYPPFTVTLTDGWFELGDDSYSPPGNNFNGVMNFDATVKTTTNFPGNIEWTQLNARNVLNLIGQSTLGFELDNDESFSGSVQVNPTNSIPFVDSPGISTSYSLGINIVDQFETHLRFKPDGTGSIWVTLGMVNWGWAGQETGGQVITSQTVEAPDYSDSDAFPVWDDVTHSSPGT